MSSKLKMQKGSNLFLPISIALSGTLCTLLVSPFISFEPINLVKLFALVSGAGLLLPDSIRLVRSMKWGKNLKSLYLLLLLLFALTLAVNIIVYRSDFISNFYGVFGRNNGTLSYLAIVIIALSSIFIVSEHLSMVLRFFEVSANLVLVYAIIQLLGLDPVDWSGEGPFSTLGNLNFSAAFLAMHSSYLLVRILLSHVLPWHTRTWYSLILLIEIYVIWRTTSIQGLAILAINLTLISIRVISKFRSKVQLTLLGFSLMAGIMVFVGSIGIGIFSKLRQETMLFRVDYWSAGLSMLREFPIFGLGFDNYGNYYREYRNFTAANRNYFDRTANTAHNIPIDVAVGGGLLSGLIYLAILILVTIVAARVILNSKDISSILLSVVSIGFIFQQFVSINQIGTAVWGWIFLSLLVNRHYSLTNNSDSPDLGKSSGLELKRQKSNTSFRSKPASQNGSLLFMRMASGLTGLVIGLIPLQADARFFQVIKQPDLNRQWLIAKGVGGNQFLMEYVLKNAVTSNNPKLIYEFAKLTSERYPRSFYAWSVRAGLVTSSMTERQSALDILRSLDPLNTEIPIRPIQG